MAQTWPMSRTRRAMLRVADSLGRMVLSPFRRASVLPQCVAKILVIEPWNIGDVVLVTPMLRALRMRYPESEICILAKSHARDLLDRSGLVDEVIVSDLPWTADKNKYRVSGSVMKEMRRLVRVLRGRHFDVTLDARMDIRSNLLASMTGAAHRIGYDIGGGGWLLTRTLASDRDGSHKIDDWLDLLDLLDGTAARGQLYAARRQPPPALVVGEDECLAAREYLSKAGAGRSPTIGYHPGGSHAGKRWPRERFQELISELSASLGGSHIVFLGPNEHDASAWPGAIVSRPSLRQLMAQIACCDVLVCNDSGPMHVADALGVPVVAIFEVGNPQWYGPSGPRATVISGELAGRGISAAPLHNPPRNPVAVTRVNTAVREILR
jgi:ADP-heptose:LPS heptosyltransferase